VSYTITSKLINIEDWSEQDVESWSQEVGLKGMERPNAVNPQYLLLIKDNEVILLDKYGNRVLTLTTEYTIDWAVVNNNGDIAVKSGADLYVYDKAGSLLYSTTFANNIVDLAIGNDYLWVILKTDPLTIYVYSLADFTYSSYSQDVYSAGNGSIQCTEDGKKAWLHYRTDRNFMALFDADTGKVNEVAITSVIYTYLKPWCRPDGLIAITTAYRVSEGTYYRHVFAVRNDMTKVTIFSATSSSLIRVYVSVDINGEKILLYESGSTTLKKYTLNIDTMTVTEGDSFGIAEAVEDCGEDTTRNGDSTPDGKYRLVTSTNTMFIIDYDLMSVKKQYSKSFTGKQTRMLAVEVT